jgi:hypothetical protein
MKSGQQCRVPRQEFDAPPHFELRTFRDHYEEAPTQVIKKKQAHVL